MHNMRNLLAIDFLCRQYYKKKKEFIYKINNIIIVISYLVYQIFAGFTA